MEKTKKMELQDEGSWALMIEESLLEYLNQP